MFNLGESMFLCRWHSGPSPEESGWAAADAIWMWRAEHGASGPQHLHPPIPEKHTAADPSHQGKGCQLPDQWWVSVCFILQQKQNKTRNSDILQQKTEKKIFKYVKSAICNSLVLVMVAHNISRRSVVCHHLTVLIIPIRTTDQGHPGGLWAMAPAAALAP